MAKSKICFKCPVWLLVYNAPLVFVNVGVNPRMAKLYISLRIMDMLPDVKPKVFMVSDCCCLLPRINALIIRA